MHTMQVSADGVVKNSQTLHLHHPNQIVSNDIQMSFSDIETGWAFFGIGQLRHNSNSSGEKYGKNFKRFGVLGVFVNMNKGTLSFAIDG